MSGKNVTPQSVDIDQVTEKHPELAKRYAAFGAQQYKTPMQKWFEPIRHIGVNYVLNSLVSIALLTEATHGSLFKYYKPVKDWTIDKGKALGSAISGGNPTAERKAGSIAEYCLGIFTLCIPGHLLTPVMSWMANREASILRWMDNKRDQWRGHTPDAVETEMRENVYAAKDARPKQTAKDMILHRVTGMATNFSIQAVGDATLGLNDLFKQGGKNAANYMSPGADMNENSPTYLQGLTGIQKRIAGALIHAPLEFTSCLNTSLGAAAAEKWLGHRKEQHTSSVVRSTKQQSANFAPIPSHGATVQAKRHETKEHAL